MVSPKSILRMRVEREEVPWCNIHFESKANVINFFTNWGGGGGEGRITNKPDVIRCLTNSESEKTLNQAQTLSINKKQIDLEFLISWWSTETNALMAF